MLMKGALNRSLFLFLGDKKVQGEYLVIYIVSMKHSSSTFLSQSMKTSQVR